MSTLCFFLLFCCVQKSHDRLADYHTSFVCQIHSVFDVFVRHSNNAIIFAASYSGITHSVKQLQNSVAYFTFSTPTPKRTHTLISVRMYMYVSFWTSARIRQESIVAQAVSSERCAMQQDTSIRGLSSRSAVRQVYFVFGEYRECISQVCVPQDLSWESCIQFLYMISMILFFSVSIDRYNI